MTDHVKLIARQLVRVSDPDGFIGGTNDQVWTVYRPEAKRVLAALAAKGLVIVDKDDVLWLRALRAAGVDNWQGIEHAIDLRDEMLATNGGEEA